MKTRAGGALAAIALGVLGIGASGSARAAAKVRVLAVEPADPKEKEVNARTIQEFEAANPGTKVEFEYLENEAFKTKLPTVLQSGKRPHLFYSWAGGVYAEQARNGLVKDLTPAVKADFEANLPRSGIQAFTYEGKINGAPRDSSLVVLWYNKVLAAKAGVDAAKIKTWDEFLAAVKKAKAAGITPIVAGGKDKWPLHFYYGYLALRIAGKDGLAAARAGKNAGFRNPDFARAGQEFKRLIDLQPFQRGFADATFDKASGLFGDGKALFHLMGDFGYANHKKTSSDGKGIPDEALGMLEFPQVTNGKGDPNDTFGGINGFLVSAGAPEEAVRFLKFFVSKPVQERSAAAGLWIPAAHGAGRALTNPFFKEIARIIGKSKHHQLYLDQSFGPAVGGAVNDAAADLAMGATTPEEAAALLEDVRKAQ